MNYELHLLYFIDYMYNINPVKSSTYWITGFIHICTEMIFHIPWGNKSTSFFKLQKQILAMAQVDQAEKDLKFVQASWADSLRQRIEVLRLRAPRYPANRGDQGPRRSRGQSDAGQGGKE